MSTIYEKLKKYSDSDYYGFHMPGHKRNLDLMPGMSPYKIDITEIDGFDDLHHAEGILLEAQRRAAKVCHADETHFLVNGSTVGILSAIAGVTKKGDTILVARNCHKSVYHAIYMNELNPVYLYPHFDEDVQLNTEISAQDVSRALDDHPQIRAVVIVSPTYDGVVSDVAAISELVHRKGLPLIVDEAHGAHFGFHPEFPKRANEQGADLVINSLHKTLPALTQTALLHINGMIVDRKRVRKYLDMLQSSSPSYVLMAGMDACMGLIAERGEELFAAYVERLLKLRNRLLELQNLKLVETENYDISKVFISVRHTDITSRELYQRLLEEYHLQMEMVAGTYVLAMTSVGDTEEGMQRLADALFEIDRECSYCEEAEAFPLSGGQPRLEKVYNSAETEQVAEKADPEAVRMVPWEKSAGSISLEYAYLYPPGSPLIVPGEKITQEAADLLSWYRAHGFSVEGLKKNDCIEVWTDG